jgi:hypothetical protein
MTLRADHVGGAAFVGLGILVIALSGDLPFGTLSLPGPGFLPNILAGLSMLFGLALVVRASAESRPFAALQWDDAKHATLVVIITAIGAAVFEWLGFVITMVLLMSALLVVIERRNVVAAAIFSLGVVGITYVTFEYVLKTPLVTGPFGF